MNSLEATQVLIEEGARLNLQTETGRTALDTAVFLGHDKLTQILREAGAE